MATGGPPKSYPKVLNPSMSTLGAGRGIGRGVAAGRGDAKQPSNPGVWHQNAVLRSAIQQGDESMAQHLVKHSKNQKQYIPGLPGQDKPTTLDMIGPADPFLNPSRAPKEVPPELIEEYVKDTKNAVCAINEYCAMTKLKCDFREVRVQKASILAKFAFVCSINDRDFPQGVGKTKKEAKTDSAKVAFDSLLGLNGDKKSGNKVYTHFVTKLLTLNMGHNLIFLIWNEPH